MKKMMGLWEGSAPPRLGHRNSQKEGGGREKGGGDVEEGVWGR